jgi:U3 small nucleolar RNA-associated protein 16
MVTTRGGTETSSSPLVKKRAAQEDRLSSPEAKRRKPTATKKSSSITQVPIRSKEEQAVEDPVVAPSITAKHIRFSSTSPPPRTVLDVPDVQPKIVEENVEDSDDDAAPEDISHSAAQEQALAAKAITTKAVQEHKTAKKTRRRRRDKKLKEQVQGSDKRNEKVEAEKKKEEEEGVDEDMEPIEEQEKVEVPKKFGLDDIPALLPDELLATEAPIRPPTPPPTTISYEQRQKKAARPVDSITAPLNIPQPKLPKDLKVGALNVRVVAPTNPLLPPKVGKSKNIKSRWLAGRPELAASSKSKKKSMYDKSKVQRVAAGGFKRGFV